MNSIRFNFLYIGDYTFSQLWKAPRFYMPYSMARYITEGEGLFEIDQKQITVKKGDVVYVPQGSLLYCESSSDTFSFLSVRFSTFATVNDTDFLTEYHHVASLFTKHTDLAKPFFDNMLYQSQQDTSYKHFALQGNLELLIAFLIEHSPQQNPAPKKPMITTVEKAITRADPRIQIVIDYLTLHPHKRYNTAFLCDLADLSESSFRRLFKEQTGKTPNQFITELKLLSASKLLIETSQPVNQIAYGVGFDSSNYFIRRFKQNFSVTPNEFRQLSRK